MAERAESAVYRKEHFYDAAQRNGDPDVYKRQAAEAAAGAAPRMKAAAAAATAAENNLTQKLD